MASGAVGGATEFVVLGVEESAGRAWDRSAWHSSNAKFPPPGGIPLGLLEEGVAIDDARGSIDGLDLDVAKVIV